MQIKTVDTRAAHKTKTRQVVATKQTNDIFGGTLSSLAAKADSKPTRRRLNTGVSHFLFNRQPPDQDITVLLNGIYVGHPFDEDGRGNTGEFYWNSVVADGSEVVLTDSAKYGVGIISHVAHEWLPISRFPLYRAEREPQAGSLTVGLRLVESDSSNEAKRVFAGLNDIAQTVLSALQVNPAVGTITDVVVKTAMDFLDLDDDDVALSRARGLIGKINNYRRGRFFQMKGDKGAVAILSVLPAAENDQRNFAYYEIEQVARSKGELPEINKESQLSFFIRRQAFPNLPLGELTFRNKDTGKSWRFKFGRHKCRSFKVPPGRYEVVTASILPVDVDIMVTAFGPHLARDSFI